MTGTTPFTDWERIGGRFVIAGLIVPLSVFVGLAGTVLGMIRAFQALETSATGIADPSRVSMAVGDLFDIPRRW